MSSAAILAAEQRVAMLQASIRDKTSVLARLRPCNNIVWWTGPSASHSLATFLATSGHETRWEMSTKYYTVMVQIEMGTGRPPSNKAKAVVMTFGKDEFNEFEANQVVEMLHKQVEVRLCWIMDEEERMSRSDHIRQWCAECGVEFLDSEEQGRNVIERLEEALTVAPWEDMHRKQVTILPVVGARRHVPIVEEEEVAAPVQEEIDADEDDDDENDHNALSSLLHEMHAHKHNLEKMTDLERRDRAAHLVMRMMESFIKDDEEEENGDG